MKKYLIFIMLLVPMYFNFACNTTAKKINEHVTIDFDARQAEGSNNEEVNPASVILRIQLMGSKADLIKYGLNTSQEQHQRQEYYILNFTRDIYLISGTDTIACNDSHMEQLYMDLPYRTFILNFGEHAIKEQDEILVMDKIFSNQALLVSINKTL